MRRSVWIKATLLFFAGCAVVNGAMARVECERKGSQMVNSIVLDVTGGLNVGPEVAVGSSVYSQKYRHVGDSLPLTCTFDNAKDTVDIFAISSSGNERISGEFGKYRNVYKTNVDGLGIAFINSVTGKDVYVSERLSMSRYFVLPGTAKDCERYKRCELFYDPSFEIVLVKTGAVKSGLLTSVPDIMYEAQSSKIIRIARFNIETNVSIVSKTCLAEPVRVDMGAHSTRVFTGIGSTAPPKDFSIELTNCPAFNGAGKKTLKFRIDPVLPAINASNGVLRLDASPSKAASGVGVQIVTTKDSPLFLGMDQDSGLSLRNTEASYSIPLRARYLQTGSNVTPGPTKASARFTIIYP